MIEDRIQPLERERPMLYKIRIPDPDVIAPDFTVYQEGIGPMERLDWIGLLILVGVLAVVFAVLLIVRSGP